MNGSYSAGRHGKQSKMRKFFIIIVLIAVNLVVAGQDSVSLKQAVAGLDKALLSKDTAALNLYLDKKLNFGHSNGWVQTKEDVRKDFASGKLRYDKFETTDVKIVAIDKEWATVVMKVAAAGVVNEKEFSLSLHVMQVWKKDKKGWQLLSRQSAKIN